MDIVQVRERYRNKLAIRGGLDKFAMRGSPGDTERECRYKIQASMQKSDGIGFGLDNDQEIHFDRSGAKRNGASI